MLKLLKRLFTNKEEKVNQDVCKLYDDFQTLGVKQTQYPRNTMSFREIVDSFLYDRELNPETVLEPNSKDVVKGFTTEEMFMVFDKHNLRRPSKRTLYALLRRFGYMKLPNRSGFDGKWYCKDIQFSRCGDSGWVGSIDGEVWVTIPVAQVA